MVDNGNKERNLLHEKINHLSNLCLIQKIDLISEQIIYIEERTESNDYILVTVQTVTNHRGLISNVNFYCYTLAQGMCTPEKVMRMFTDLIYSQDYSAVEKIEIVDILGKPNMGYGSKTMNVFFDYIKQFHAKEIFGVLSFVDEIDLSNKNRRNYFYRKYGFEINNNHILKKL